MQTPTDGAPVIAPVPAKQESWLPLALDFGPLLIFFVAYKIVGMIVGTAAFMAAIAVAVLVSKVKLGKVSPMLWLSAILVLFFGSLTIYFRDERFIQIKPTIIYSFFAVMLLGGWLRGKPLLKYLLGAAYKGLTEQGWLKLSRNWGFFFIGMAAANEAMRASLSFDNWLSVKVWGITIVSMLFAVANVPMLLRNGLDLGEDKGQ
ncbi:septation protein IspZ [Sphingobium sufflavum]|uniref:septation protein IspZ n=1 Tax=Sphingobium sufflavum TaxID=1129547 RepID=UPI001F2721F0|nr:septation protein IspZ [Sphingobium sufflavum]MCE7798772.1 septation protein IspZ [Sphingobium sufflavum]